MLYFLVSFVSGLALCAAHYHGRVNRAILSQVRVNVWREKTLMVQEARNARTPAHA